jgi:peptide subunit release factor 1 (eRF1)
MLISPSLGHVASAEDIAREARQAATTLRSAHGQRLLADVLESAGAQGRATIGMRSVQRALALHAVEVLLLSPDFIADAPIDAEMAVRAAIAGGATIEILSGEAAEQLDQAANGIGARLRFALDKGPYKDYPSREKSDPTQARMPHENARAGFTETDLAFRDRRITRA